MTTPIFLAHRSIISVTGADAEPFLNNIVTVSTLDLAAGELRYGALLTPQGKVIADMLLAREGETILIDCDTAAAPALAKRLTLMKLRAAVAIRERPDLGVRVFAGGPDPRSPLAPQRKIEMRDAAGDASAYHAARIAAGLPEQGADFGAEDVFPADINMDLLGGVDFRKGCFVGQEVVSRMQHKTVTRTRVVPVTFQGNAPAEGAEVKIGGKAAGFFGSSANGRGLAKLRLDRVEDGLKAGEKLSVGNIPIKLTKPDWAKFPFPGEGE